MLPCEISLPTWSTRCARMTTRRVSDTAKCSIAKRTQPAARDTLDLDGWLGDSCEWCLQGQRPSRARPQRPPGPRAQRAAGQRG